MRRWRKRKGSTFFGAVLAAIAVIAISPAAHSEQAGAGTAAPVSDQQQNPPKTDAASDRDKNSGEANSAPENADQQPPAQQQGGQQSATPPPTTQDDQKGRLAVNPVTGLTWSSAKNFTPLTGKERWKLYLKQNYTTMGAYFRPVFFALVLDQATGSPSQWGGGFGGFGPRVGSRLLSNITQGTIRAPLAAVLHEDVRYVTDHQGGKRRVLHAIEYSFLTYNDQGHPTFNVAKFAGYYGSTAISTAWRPGKHALLSYTLTNGSEQVALSVPVNIMQEFWPEIARYLHKL